MPKVAIVLATWNGARFLPALLASLSAQTIAPCELIIADDGSNDDTLALIDTWAASAPFPVRILSHDGIRLGPAKAFARLLEATTADIVLPCDQDDVWLPHKVAVCAQLATDATPRLLVHDLRLTNAHGAVTQASFWRHQGFKPRQGMQLRTLVAMNSFPGCAMALNRALITRALPMPDSAVMHDWWIALVAAATGRIRIWPQALVDYRQHANNTWGAHTGSIADRALRILKPWSSGYHHLTIASQRQAHSLLLRLGTEAPSELKTWATLKDFSTFERRMRLYRSGIRKTGLLRNLGMMARA